MAPGTSGLRFAQPPDKTLSWWIGRTSLPVSYMTSVQGILDKDAGSGRLGEHSRLCTSCQYERLIALDPDMNSSMLRDISGTSRECQDRMFCYGPMASWTMDMRRKRPYDISETGMYSTGISNSTKRHLALSTLVNGHSGDRRGRQGRSTGETRWSTRYFLTWDSSVLCPHVLLR